jgi:hypothetical protein
VASTLTRGPGLGQNGASRSVGIDPGRHRRRSLPLALVALGCMAVSIAAFVGLQLAASDRAAVLAVARPVAAGTAISDDDLTVAQVSTDPALAPIPLSARASVLGRTAAVDLAPGTLLVDSVLGQARGLDAGEAIVGVAVAAGAAPVQTLAVGDRVQLVETPAPGAATAAGSGRSVLAEGRVTDLARGSGSSSSTGLQLAVAVPAAAAPSIAASAAEGRIAVVVLP